MTGPEGGRNHGASVLTLPGSAWPGAGPWSGFAEAADAALALLQAEWGLDLWAVTQVRGGDQVVVAARSTGFPVPPGAVFPWAESLCVRMCSGVAPRIAPRAREVPAYTQARATEALAVGAYVGTPLALEGGQVFGTLCGISREEQSEDLHRILPLLEFVGGVLSTLLAKEALAADLSAAAAEAYARTSVDGTTLMANPRGWEQALRIQDDRRVRYGESASVLVVRLREVGDAAGAEERVRQLSGLLHVACRPSDVRARLGEAEFAVLAVNCDPGRQEALRERLGAACAAAGLDVVVGTAAVDSATGVPEAWRLASERAGTSLATVLPLHPDWQEPLSDLPEPGGVGPLPEVERHELPYAVVVRVSGEVLDREAVLTLRTLLPPALHGREDHRPVLFDLTGLRSWSVPAQLTLLRSARGLRQHGRYVAAYGLADALVQQATSRGWGQWVPCYRDLAAALAHLPH